jgi:hypothetical protein
LILTGAGVRHLKCLERRVQDLCRFTVLKQCGRAADARWEIRKAIIKENMGENIMNGIKPGDLKM